MSVKSLDCIIDISPRMLRMGQTFTLIVSCFNCLLVSVKLPIQLRQRHRVVVIWSYGVRDISLVVATLMWTSRVRNSMITRFMHRNHTRNSAVAIFGRSACQPVALRFVFCILLPKVLTNVITPGTTKNWMLSFGVVIGEIVWMRFDIQQKFTLWSI